MGELHTNSCHFNSKFVFFILHVPYLPVYNTCPCIIRTPILKRFCRKELLINFKETLHYKQIQEKILHYNSSITNNENLGLLKQIVVIPHFKRDSAYLAVLADPLKKSVVHMVSFAVHGFLQPSMLPNSA